METKRLPAVMGVAIVVHMTLGFLKFLMMGKDPAWMHSEAWFLAMSGVAVAGTACLAAGGFELAERLAPDRARIIRIVATTQLVGVGFEMLMGVYEVAVNETWGWTLSGWMFSIIIVGAATGYAIAARGTGVWGVFLVPLAVTISPPPPLMEWIWTQSGTTLPVVLIALRVGYYLALGILLVALARTSVTTPADRSVQALGWLHRSLRTRVAAIGVLIAGTLFAVSAQSVAAVRFMVIAPVLVNIGAAVVFAAGTAVLARGVRRGVAIALAVATWGSAWMAGVLANQVGFTYGITTPEHLHDERYQQAATALEVPLKVTVIGTVAIALVALMVHLQQRGPAELARFVRLRATLFVVLMIIAATLAEQIFSARSSSTVLMAAVFTAGFGIAGLMTAAGAFKRAAASTGAVELPTATLVDD